MTPFNDVDNYTSNIENYDNDDDDDRDDGDNDDDDDNDNDDDDNDNGDYESCLMMEPPRPSPPLFKAVLCRSNMHRRITND